jgi:hypothetical protein
MAPLVPMGGSTLTGKMGESASMNRSTLSEYHSIRIDFAQIGAPSNAVQEMEQQQEVTYVYYVSSNESAEDIQPDQNEVSTGTTTIGTKLRVDRKQEVDRTCIVNLIHNSDSDNKS